MPNGKTVLIVDDDEAFLYIACLYLETLGFETIAANGFDRGLECSEVETVDAVVTDIQLNDGEPDGIVLRRMLRARRPNLPVVVITGFPDLAVEADVPVFLKPLDLDVLAQVLMSYLQK
jgi:DNA-binding NtrC family response regulator